MEGKLALWDRWSLALESDTWKALDIFLEAQEHLGVWEDRTLVASLQLEGFFPVSLSLPSTWLHGVWRAGGHSAEVAAGGISDQRVQGSLACQRQGCVCSLDNANMMVCRAGCR